MFNLKNKKLIRIVCFCLLLLALSAYLVPALKLPYLDISKYPLVLAQLIGSEIKAVIFYHRNSALSRELGREVGLLNQKINALNEAALENARLHQMLSFKEKQPFKVVAARLIGRCPDSWTSCIIIDKGRKNGIRRGMPVVTYLGLAGRIIEVSSYASKALLVNDPNLKVSAINQRSRQEGLVSGTLGNYLIMRYLPEEADIKAQDLIVTSGLNSTFPKGLVIGTVVDISQDLSGLSRYALIKPAVCLSCIEEVLVVAQ